MDEVTAIDRTQALLTQILERIVRLEHRLETAKLLPEAFGDPITRFAFERNIELEPGHFASSKGRPISLSFQNKVWKWLEAHESDEKPSFVALAESVGGSQSSPEITSTLQYFHMQGQWTDVIEALERSGHPLRKDGVTSDPYGRETQAKKA